MKNLQPTNTSSFMAVDQHSALIRLHIAATPSNFVTVEQHSMFISWRNSDDRPKQQLQSGIPKTRSSVVIASTREPPLGFALCEEPPRLTAQQSNAPGLYSALDERMGSTSPDFLREKAEECVALSYQINDPKSRVANSQTCELVDASCGTVH